MRYLYRILKIGAAIYSIVLFPGLSDGQNTVQQNLIAASQAGARCFFILKRLNGRSFSNPVEFKGRDGLPPFFRKLKSDKSVTIGYLGGSITRADNQYQVQSAKFIQSLFPEAKITGINAGV